MNDIRELKNKIENNTLDDAILIFKYNKVDFEFLCEHYVNEIANVKKLEKIYISSLDELVGNANSDGDFFAAENIKTPYLYIYKTDTLLSLGEYYDVKNLIIVCGKVSKDIKIDYIDFPAVQNWQIEDFVKMRAPGLNDDMIKWLCNICKYDFYRLDNELKKIEIFDKKLQPIIFNQMSDEGVFSDLNTLNIMSLTNAIMQKDLFTINTILSDLKNIDIEATGLCTLLLRQFKCNIEVEGNRAWNPDLLCTEKQFNYLKRNHAKYSTIQMYNIYEFLTSLDMRLKSGELQFKADNRPNNNSFADYIVANVLTLGK